MSQQRLASANQARTDATNSIIGGIGSVAGGAASIVGGLPSMEKNPFGEILRS